MIKLRDLIGLPNLQYHLDNNLKLSECVYRYSSDSFVELFSQARKALLEGSIQLSEEDTNLILETDIGEYGYYGGVKVPLDLPMVEETLEEALHRGKEVDLNKPKRGGTKKFYVYVKNDKGNVIKVNFGDTSGLNVKINDPKARASFAARHKCSTKKDKTKAGYWACRITRYAKSLGMKKNYSGYW